MKHKYEPKFDSAELKLLAEDLHDVLKEIDDFYASKEKNWKKTDTHQIGKFLEIVIFNQNHILANIIERNNNLVEAAKEKEKWFKK